MGWATVKPAPDTAAAMVGSTAAGKARPTRAKPQSSPHESRKGGILLRRDGRRSAGGGGARRRVTWRPIIVEEEEEHAPSTDSHDWDVAHRARVDAISRYLRLPILLYEEIMIPLRVAFPVATVESGSLLVLDLLTDVLELLSLEMIVVRVQLPAILASTAPGAPRADDPNTFRYPPLQAALSWASFMLLHAARLYYYLGGSIAPWVAVQVLRITRVHDLMAFIQKLNNDLATSASLIGPFKFFVVLFSVPHWWACAWWAVALRGGETAELPSWVAQYAHFTGNESLAPDALDLGESYLLSIFVAWSGMTGMGYGSLVISARLEVLLAVLAALAQIVFYAFVFGTLLHFLIRVDQNVLRNKMVLQAAERFGKERKLPPALVGRIREYYAFQHRKQTAGAAQIVGKMPLSMRTEVATAQYARELSHSYLFRGCSAQLRSSLVLLLRERFLLPREVLFSRGDGSTELLWCAAGALDSFKGDKYIGTIRSDLGPGQIVGEGAFLLGTQHPYTISASAAGEVTLIVLSKEAYERVLLSYPEEKATVLATFLRRYGLDSEGNDVGGLEGEQQRGGGGSQLDEDELRELREQKGAIRRAILLRHEESLSVMRAAVGASDIEAIRELLARGYAVDTRDFDGRSALHLAAALGNAAVVGALVEAAADLNCADRWGRTPVELAVAGRHGAVAAQLEASGAALTIADGAERLHEATRAADTALVQMLLQNGVDVNARDHDASSALHAAAARGSSRVVEFLVTQMADVNATDRWGRTPLDTAITHGHLLVAKLLVPCAARASEAVLARELNRAARAANLPAIKFVVEYGCAVDAADYDGRTALHTAVASRSMSATHLLLASMADPAVRDKWGRTPLAHALLEGDAKLAAVLLMYSGESGAREVAAADEEMGAALRAARALDTLALMRELHSGQKLMATAALQRQSLEHEIEISLKGAVNTLRALARDERALYRLLAPRAEQWADVYGADADDAPLGARDASELQEEDEDDDEQQQPGSTTARGFVRAVLQLPSAERGLARLRALYDEAMRGAGSPAEEASALEAMLATKLGIEPHAAQAVVAELLERLTDTVTRPRPHGARHRSLLKSTGSVGSPQGKAAEPPSARRPSESRPDDSAALGAAARRRSSVTGEAVLAIGQAHAPPRLASAVGGRGFGRRASAPPYEESVLPVPDSFSASGFALLFTSKPFIDALRRTAHRAADGGGGAETPPTAAGGTPPGTPPRTPPPPPPPRRSRSRSPAFEPRFSARSSRASFGGSVRSGLSSGRRSGRVSGLIGSISPAAVRRRGAHPLGADAAARADDSQGGEGGEAARAVPPEAEHVARAVAILLKLFRVFSDGNASSVRLSSVRAVGRQVGEMGGANVKALHRLLAQAADVPTTTSDAGVPSRLAPRRSGASGILRSSGGGSSRSQLLRTSGGADQGDAISLAGSARPSQDGVPPLFGALEAGEGAAARHAPTVAPISPEAEEEAAPAGEAEEEEAAAPPPAEAADSARAAAAAEADEPPPSLGLVVGAHTNAPSRLAHAALRGGTVTIEQFVLATAVWIMSASLQEAEPGGGGGPGADHDQPAAGHAAKSEPTVASPDGTGVLSLGLNLKAGLGKERAEQPRADALDGGARAPHAATALDAAGAAEHDGGAYSELERALAGARARGALARAIHTRAETGRLRLPDAAEAEVLLKLAGLALPIHPATSAQHVSRWCGEALGLELHAPSKAPAAAAAALVAGADEDAEARQPLATWERLAAALLHEGGRAGSAPSEAGGGAEGAGGAAPDAAPRRPWFVLSARGRLAARVHAAYIGLACVDLFLVPVQLAFAPITRRMPYLRWATLALDCLYWCRMGLRLCTGFVNESSVEVCELRAIRHHYLTTDFPLDLLANFPFDLFVWALGGELFAVFLLRLLRLINARVALRAYLGWRRSLKDTQLLAGIAHHMLILLLTLHAGACVWNALASAPGVREAYPRSFKEDHEQMRQEVGAEIDISADPLVQLADLYLIDLWLVLSVISTLGLPGLPTNPLELGFVLTLCVVNMTVFASVVGHISGLVMRQDDDIVAKRAQLEVVQSFIKHARVPPALKRKMSAFFVRTLQAESLSDVHDGEIYAGLPLALQIEVARHTTRPMLEYAPLLAGTSHGFLSRLAATLRSRALDADSVLFRSGEACRTLYFVSDGAVQLYREGDERGGAAEQPAVLDVRGRGEPLGELAFVFGTRHTHSARAVAGEETRVLALSAEAYHELAETFPGQADVVMENAMGALDGDGADGAATARSSGLSASGLSTSRRSSVSAGSAADAGGGALDDDAVSVASADARAGEEGAGESEALQAVVASARKRQSELQHMRLCLASAAGDVEKLQRVLTSKHADVDGADFQGRRALHLAACGGHARAIALLLAHRAAVDAHDERGSTPLLDALRSKHARAAVLLAEHGGTCGSRAAWQRVLFALARDPAAGPDLAALGPCRVDANVTDAAGRTALHVTAADGLAGNIEALLLLGARVDATDASGATPLQDALLAGHEACFGPLLARGAALGPSFEGARALNTAARADDTPALARLLRCRCDVNAADALGRTPLHVAASSAAQGAVHFLLRQPGINVRAEDAFGRTALDDAEALRGPPARVLPAMLDAAGGARGSGRRARQRGALGRSMQEEGRLRADRAAVRGREATVCHARELCEWAEAMRARTAAFLARAHAAVAHERAHGPTLSEAMPGLWAELQDFAEQLLAHRTATLSVALPAVERLVDADAQPYAAQSACALRDKLIQLSHVHERLSRPLLHLAETEFVAVAPTRPSPPAADA